jgi:hypothetical protein
MKKYGLCFAHITECCYVVKFLALYLRDSNLIVNFESRNFVTVSLQFPSLYRQIFRCNRGNGYFYILYNYIVKLFS